LYLILDIVYLRTWRLDWEGLFWMGKCEFEKEKNMCLTLAEVRCEIV